jgi:succinate-semialdehyde dehydrogenase/glutarate-semialdehyde dehydrogenase
MVLRAINPFNERPLREYRKHSPSEVRAKLQAAQNAARTWREVSMADRADLMRSTAAVLRRHLADHATLMTSEMGKPIVAAEGEIEKCAACCEHFARHAEEYLAPETIATDALRSGVRYEPLGAVLAIMPWNFPFWQVFRFAAPALMAGNVGLLKHAPNVPGCALAIESIFREAGFPAGVFTSLLIDTQAIEAIIRDPIIRAVTLTGSERAGRSVAAIAGSALKKTVLELGGSDPFIVLADADPLAAAKAAVAARTINAGQSCIAAKRFIVVGKNLAFEEAFAAALSAIKIGDPLDRQTEMGPLARLDLLQNLHQQVQDSLALGATLIIGGHRLPRPGYFYAPTLLADVRPGMPAFDDETFGPVAALIHADDTDHAIDLANATRFGLGASIWTHDVPAAESRTVPRIEAGAVFINGPVKSDPRLPFGGIKQSGYGRELSAAGIREFVNIKTLWAAAPTPTGETLHHGETENTEKMLE